MAGLASSSPITISASVMLLARLLFHFSSVLLHVVPSLLPSVLLLLRMQHRDVVKVSCAVRGSRSALQLS